MMNEEDLKEYHNLDKKNAIWNGKPKFDYKSINV